MCIVQVSHAHPPFAAAVFNCYQMYSKGPCIFRPFQLFVFLFKNNKILTAN